MQWPQIKMSEAAMAGCRLRSSTARMSFAGQVRKNPVDRRRSHKFFVIAAGVDTSLWLLLLLLVADSVIGLFYCDA